MANYCDYKVIVKGRRNACYAFFGSMSCLDDKSIVEETGTDAACTLRFAGNCKWSVDAYCAPWDGPCPVALPDNAFDAMALAEEKYHYHTVQSRSRMFAVEVLCNSADVEDYDPDLGPYQIFEHYLCGQPADGDCPEVLRIRPDEEDEALSPPPLFPTVIPIEGTGYAGRIARIEFVTVGDPLVLKADFSNPYYSPVAVEVFNARNETLGYLCDGYNGIPLEAIAGRIDELKARVASVTPLSRRGKRARYALMDVELSL